MIQSMTGYGKSVIQLDTKKITLEIKSLNSKNLDINTRFPGVYREKEIEVIRLIARKLIRGKAVSYKHLTLPTTICICIYRWSPYN